MWPFKKKEKHQIFFECEDWAVRKYAPVQLAKNFMPTAFKDMPTFLNKADHMIDRIKTVKACPGIIDYCSAGFVIPAWCDIELIPTDDGKQVIARYSHPKFNHAVHSQETLQDLLINKFSVRTAIKLDNPWAMWAADGYSLMYLPMYYYDDTRNWEAVPGWADHDLGAVRNPVIVMLKEIKYTKISMGEPLVQVVPIKRETITAYTGKLSEVAVERQHGLSFVQNMTFNGWLKYVRHKKSYNIDVHDIELPVEVKKGP